MGLYAPGDASREEAKDDADTLIHLLYARRLVDAGAVAVANQPIVRAVASLSSATPPDLSGRVFALAGYIAAHSGDDRRAEEWLQHAVNSRQEDTFLFLGLGILAIHRQRALEAVKALTEATRLAPARAEAWSSLGAAFLLGAEPERAVDPCRRAVTLAPRDPQKHAELARALEGSRRYAEAEKESRTAAELAPQNPNDTALPAIAQATSARTETEYHQAAGLLCAALVTRPEDAHLHAMLAGLHLRFGQYGSARQELELSLAHDPGNPDGWHNLATVCERLGDRRATAAAHARFQQLADLLIESAELKQAALLHNNDPEVLLRLADVFRRLGKNREAHRALAQAARLRPNDPQIARTLRTLQAAPPEGAEQK
jgi:Flp pilus assembly protein TadD